MDGNSWLIKSMESNATDLDDIDWSNEESIRYLSAINCLHNYAVGKSTEHEMVQHADKSIKPSKKMFLSFAETLEQIQVLDADAVSLAQNMGCISDMTNQEVRSGHSESIQNIESSD
jgi:hypothetical protein